MSSAEHWINHFKMQKHPEGGHYREVYRADHELIINKTSRPICTSIYYLLQKNEFSTFHKLDADEIWHHYAGGNLKLHIISPLGKLQTKLLSSSCEFQVIVPAGHWFAAELASDVDYALIGCTVSPGFVFEQFELATRETLLALNVNASDIIYRLTPGD